MAGSEPGRPPTRPRRDGRCAKANGCAGRIPPPESAPMRTLLFCLASLLLATSPTFAQTKKKEFKLYAQFTLDTRVELSDGAMWMMDKGDTFPVVAYKNQQKNIVLQLAGATFMIDTARIRILKDEEVEAGLEAYRKNVRAYLESRSGQLQEELKTVPVKPKEEAGKVPAVEPLPEGGAKAAEKTKP